MKKFFIFIFALFLGLIFGYAIFAERAIDKLYAADAPWPPLKYERVKAYLYNINDPNPGTLPNPNILEQGKLASSVVDSAGVELSPAQVQRLVAATNKIPPHLFGTVISSSMCIFDPHHAFVFYDSKGIPVATIEICTLCHQVELSPTRKQYYQQDFDEINALCKELNLPVFSTHEELDAYRKAIGVK